MNNQDLKDLADVIRENRFYLKPNGIRAIADLFEKKNKSFKRIAWYHYIDGKSTDDKFID